MLARSGIVMGALTLGISLAAPAWAADPSDAAGGYRVLNKYELGGQGRWDYLTVDPEARRLYISRESHVMVMDADTGKSVGDIPNTAGVHGIAIAHDLERGFTSNGKAATVTIFDLKTLKAVGSAKTGDNPDSILFDSFTKRVFTFNGRSKDSTAIDAASGKVVGTIALKGKPEFSVSDGAGHIYANIEDKSEVVQIDPQELKVTARWSIAPGKEPSGLALDIKNHRLFSVCDNKMMIVLDSESGKVLANLPIGEEVDGAGFDPSTGNAFSSNGDGSVTVVHEDDPNHFTVLQSVTTPAGARTMTVDAKTHKLFLPTAKSKTAAGRGRAEMEPNSFMIVEIGR